MTAPSAPPPMSATAPIRLGLRENAGQFALLVLVNAFVGAMVGMERTVLPLMAEREFGLASRSAALAFIASFGVVKAITNLFAGGFSDRFGRRRVLIARVPNSTLQRSRSGLPLVLGRTVAECANGAIG